MKVWINGELIDKENARISVFDHGVLYGDGVFEGIRVYGGRIFRCADHVDRLYTSAKTIRLPLAMTKQEITAAIERTVAANGVVNGYIRLVVTRGPGTLGLDHDKCSGGVVFIIAEQLKMYPQEMYDNGMAVIIAKTRRITASMIPPWAKSCNYLNNILAKAEAIDAGVSEAVMLNTDGNVAEATGDNIFIVSDGTVITPPPEADILVGVTRKVVMELAEKLGIPFQERTVTPDQLHAADECFLTGTGAEVIAVTQVDGRAIGSGKPGPITNRLLAAFRELTGPGATG